MAESVIRAINRGETSKYYRLMSKLESEKDIGNVFLYILNRQNEEEELDFFTLSTFLHFAFTRYDYPMLILKTAHLLPEAVDISVIDLLITRLDNSSVSQVALITLCYWITRHDHKMGLKYWSTYAPSFSFEEFLLASNFTDDPDVKEDLIEAIGNYGTLDVKEDYRIYLLEEEAAKEVELPPRRRRRRSPIKFFRDLLGNSV